MRTLRNDQWQKIRDFLTDCPDVYLGTEADSRPSLCSRCRKKNGGQAEQALGRSRGGFSTKIYISVDGLGNPLRLILTPGQAGDSPQAAALIADSDAECIIGDKAYDSDAIRQQVAEMDAEAIIPPHPNRKEPADY